MTTGKPIFPAIAFASSALRAMPLRGWVSFSF